MKTKMINTGDIVPYVNNPRKNENAVESVAASIAEFDFQQPIVVDKDMVVIAGHTRLLAAKKLNIEKVPVKIATELTPAQIKAYRIADNKTNEFASWDNDLLLIELESIQEEDINIDLSVTGFTDTEIKNLAAAGGTEEDDDAPDLPDKSATEVGDLWLLGDHKLICGDATNTDDLKKLCDGSLVDMVFTDPPYNVDYSGRGKNNLGTIENDNMEGDQFSAFLDSVFTNIDSAMKPLACIYVCYYDGKSEQAICFEDAFQKHFKKACTLIWLKQSAGMGWQDYRSQHEPILYGWKEGEGRHYFAGGRSKSTIWQFNRDAQQKYKHPTQKPVELAREAIINSSKGSDLILDPFCGSGTTLIACETAGRYCRAMELDPKYCDVIAQRWQKITGRIPVLNGKEFNKFSV